jgi:hypothetical protein
VGGFSTPAKFLSGQRHPPAKTTTVSTEAAALKETPTVLAARQVSPQLSAALLSILCTDSAPQRQKLWTLSDFQTAVSSASAMKSCKIPLGNAP